MRCITTTRYSIQNVGWNSTETLVSSNMYVIPHRNLRRFLQPPFFRSLSRNTSVCSSCASLIHGSYPSTRPITRSNSSPTSTSQPLFVHLASVLSMFFFLRVEGLAEKSSIKSKIDFRKLRHSLSELREASLRLDEEKFRAHWRLKKALWKLRHRRVIRHKLRKVYCKVRRWFGKECHSKHRHEDGHNVIPLAPPGPIRVNEHVKFKRRIGRLPGWIEEQGGHHRGSGHKPGHGHCGHSRKEVIRAAKHVHDINKRLSKFEQGFISEDGIKDREWYRHLGVAPGKWLGACWFHARV